MSAGGFAVQIRDTYAVFDTAEERDATARLYASLFGRQLVTKDRDQATGAWHTKEE